jgi:IstB-like ATP binding protein
MVVAIHSLEYLERDSEKPTYFMRQHAQLRLPSDCGMAQSVGSDIWTETTALRAERLTGALLDRLTHHVHILQMNGDSYRLNHSKSRSRRASSETPVDNPTQA